MGDWFMRHPNLDKWEKKLKKALDELDDFLEDRYGGRYRLHPVRAKRGETANKAQDGLFDIVASFTLGKGSQLGRGYIVDVDMATLEDVSDEVRQEIESTALRKLRKIIPKHFPDTDLKVDQDGRVIKIHGDLSLGKI